MKTRPSNRDMQRLAFENAILIERISGLERQLKAAQEALLAAVSSPAVVNEAGTGPSGPGFALVAQQALANADEAPKTPGSVDADEPRGAKITWFSTTEPLTEAA